MNYLVMYITHVGSIVEMADHLLLGCIVFYSLLAKF